MRADIAGSSSDKHDGHGCVPIILSILKRSMVGIRAAIAFDFVISIPATAIIGFVIAILSMGLTFTATVRAYFAYRS